MVALDTNIVVRILTGDDPDQLVRARALLTSETVFISTTVLLETTWVLRSLYGYKKADVLKALILLSKLPNVILQDNAAFGRAPDWASRGMGLADALHLAQSEGCEAFITFDLDLIRAATALGQPAREP